MDLLDRGNKDLVVYVSGILLIIGLSFIAFGSWLVNSEVNFHSMLTHIPHNRLYLSNITIVFGITSTLLIIVALWGIFFEKTWTSKKYNQLLLGAFLLQVSGVIFIVVISQPHKADPTQSIQGKKLLKTLSKFNHLTR